MKLITKAIAEALPPLYANEDKNPEDIKVPLKLFNPVGQGYWYITEMNPETGIMFGWCDLGFPELGYVDFNELKALQLPFGLSIERDMNWDGNTTLRQVMDGEKS